MKISDVILQCEKYALVSDQFHLRTFENIGTVFNNNSLGSYIECFLRERGGFYGHVRLCGMISSSFVNLFCMDSNVDGDIQNLFNFTVNQSVYPSTASSFMQNRPCSIYDTNDYFKVLFRLCTVSNNESVVRIASPQPDKIALVEYIIGKEAFISYKNAYLIGDLGLLKRIIDAEARKFVPSLENLRFSDSEQVSRGLAGGILTNSLTISGKTGCFLFIPVHSHKKIVGSIVLHMESCSSEDEIESVSFVKYLGTKIFALFSEIRLTEAYTRSAISAIMSRNMSHNLGSHVLTRKVREPVVNAIEFVRDSQILDKYLQQRMDFLAQISTDQPKWLDTACLSHQVMALFLKQRKILQYITKSEGLTATEFEENGTIKKNSDETPRLGFVMRYLKQKEGQSQDVKPLLNFTATNKAKDMIVFPDRVPVAFPGGSIGWQALFAILEGFLRNVAKHSYAGWSDDEKKDLNILIDIVDDGKTFTITKKPALRIRLYTDVSINVPCEKTEDGVQLKDKVDELNCKLARSFIDNSTGQLRKTDWGLSELRICAGFLQQADVMDIGGDLTSKAIDERVVSVKKADGTLLRPLNNKHRSYDLLKNQPKGKDNRFFFEFKVLKPRIIGTETEKGDWTDEKKETIPKQRQAEGWGHCECKAPTTPNADRSFEYYVLGPDNKFGQDVMNVLMETNKIPLGDEIGGEKCPVYGNLDYYPGRLFVVSDQTPETYSKGTLAGQLRKRICVLSKKDWKQLEKWYNGDNTSSKDNEPSPTDKAALFLQQKWVEHLFVNVRGFNKEQGNKEQGLVLYHFLNEKQSLDFSIYSPNTTPYKDKQDNEENLGLSPKIILRTGKKESQDCALVFGRHFGILENSESSEPTIRIEFAEFRWTEESNDAVQENLLYAKDKLLYGEGMSGNASYYSIAEQVFSEKFELKELLDNKVDFSEQRLYSSARMLLRFAETALLRVVVIDERFQELFSSLQKEETLTLTRVAEQQVFAGYLDSDTDYTQAKPSPELLKFGYVQIHKDQGKYKAVLKRTHDLPEYPELFQAAGDFCGDILIIHQGILDKWFEKSCNENNKKDEKKVVIGKLLKELKQYFQYVAITSGRGRPNENDMPSGVRFLPLSCFESGPQSGHYEKYPLVQQVLEIVETRER